MPRRRFPPTLLPLLMALLVSAGPARAVQELPGELQGRRNPYKPLFVPASPAQSLPSVAALPLHRPARISALDRLRYVGIAYDENEAVAAVSNGERTWFVRKGDRFDGATVSEIGPHKLIWKKGGRLVIKHLRRDSGAR